MVGICSCLCCARRRTKSGLKNIGRRPEKQQKLFDIGWSDESNCRACHNDEGTEKHRLYHCPEWHEVRRQIPEAFGKWEQKARASKEWKWQRGVVTHHLNGSQWNRSHFRKKKVGAREAQELGHASRRLRGPRALCWDKLESGEHVAGQWCNRIMKKKWSPCMGCMLDGGAHHAEGGADGILLSSQESFWTHQGACRQ